MDSFSIWFSWILFASFTRQLKGHGSLACMEEERTGLLKLKEAFRFPNASALSSWGEEYKNCCVWENVRCDAISKRVSQLSINRIDNVSFINTEEDWYLDLSLFLPFRELKNLSLAWNLLRGFTGEMRSSKLQYVDLGWNRLTDIPSFLSGQKALKYLDLESNCLTNLSHFKDLTTLSALETLNLGYNDITSDILPSIGSLASLKALSFRNSKLTGSFPKELDLSLNSLTGVIPLCLSNLTSLKLLELSENLFIGNIPSTLFQNLTSLEYISLSYNHFEGLISFGSFSLNSKLEVFELDSHNNELEVDTENPPWTPLFQLKVLRLSNYPLNQPTGYVPTFLLSQHDLRVVNLSHNSMVGEVPSWLFQNNTNLEFLSLANNSLTGRFLLHPHSRNMNMFRLDISLNEIQAELPDSIGSVLPNLLLLNMSANMLQGSIPSSLSNNYLHGPLLPRMLNVTKLVWLYLDNNNFSGELPRGLLNSINLRLLDISNNLISGEMPNWLGDFLRLDSLVLSDNSFEGRIPPNFCNLKQLSFLDLSHNRFSGLIPSCVNLASLKYLHLQGNDFMGLLPRILSGSTSLVTLDVRDNKLSGEIPRWISSLSSLRVLLLKKNNLNGSIPSEICHLKNVSILDLSFNKFAGPIPSCLYQIPFGSRILIYNTFATDVGWLIQYALSTTYSYESELSVNQYGTADVETGVEEEIEFMSKSRFESYKGNILYYISGIDLSHNELSGYIPNELGYLSNLHTLNLSHNNLGGSIPTTFSRLKQIQSLDSSFNRLSGEIPSELTQLNFLSVFSVAYNNLSGSIPDRKAQFGTLEENSYTGNPLLCGPPLQRSCTRSKQSPSPSMPPRSEEKESFHYEFGLSFLISYLAAFLGVVSFLYIEAYYMERLVVLVKAKINVFLLR
ncbi:Leucine-rich repeat protein [Handroanthus impetiginosus]|uniref:Leucine-rich repeat protein n=1 Tax=Handroanthus impetiginosus TaxID=429701 RepID=A0A2G9GBI8_9LAMI|nr:Leucine-rich repeat protein [Handroanthus impetiginosus]